MLQFKSNQWWCEENSLVRTCRFKIQDENIVVLWCVCVCVHVCLGLKGIRAAQPKHVVTFFFALLLVLAIMFSFRPLNVRKRPRLASAAHCVLTEGVKWSLTGPSPRCLERPFTFAFTGKKDPVCSCYEPLESLFLKLTNIAKRGSFLIFLLAVSCRCCHLQSHSEKLSHSDPLNVFLHRISEESASPPHHQPSRLNFHMKHDVP